jgi:hypothetical protein
MLIVQALDMTLSECETKSTGLPDQMRMPFIFQCYKLFLQRQVEARVANQFMSIFQAWAASGEPIEVSWCLALQCLQLIAAAKSVFIALKPKPCAEVIMTKVLAVIRVSKFRDQEMMELLADLAEAGVLQSLNDEGSKLDFLLSMRKHHRVRKYCICTKMRYYCAEMSLSA